MRYLICASIKQNTWVICKSTSTYTPSFITVSHTELLIFAFFVISQSDMQMRYLICRSTTTEHIGNTWVHYYPHTKFRHCSPYRTFDICLFRYSQSEQICKWAIWYAHLVMTDYVGNTCVYHYLHNKFYENQSLHSSKGLPFCWRATYRQRDNKNLSGPSWQTTKKKKKRKTIFQNQHYQKEISQPSIGMGVSFSTWSLLKSFPLNTKN